MRELVAGLVLLGGAIAVGRRSSSSFASLGEAKYAKAICSRAEDFEDVLFDLSGYIASGVSGAKVERDRSGNRVIVIGDRVECDELIGKVQKVGSTWASLWESLGRATQEDLDEVAGCDVGGDKKEDGTRTSRGVTPEWLEDIEEVTNDILSVANTILHQGGCT
jgi:hypothetical protein